MFGLGTTEILVIAFLILIFFGARRLPEIGEGLGKAIREFRNVKKEMSPEKKPEDPEAGKAAGGSSVGKEIAQAVENKVAERIPLVGKAKKLKDKADSAKNLFS